ncbi:MAG: SRPBCC domain-containing protein [bacterium]|nr:SRPBCC domain-containing protein [bacterium]
MSRVEIQASYQAAREEVFAAFSRPAAIEQWLGPSDEFRTTVHEFEFRPGGKYRIEFLSPEGETSVLTGSYSAIEAPERIVFSWRWIQNTEFPDSETRVTVQLSEKPEGDGTLLRLTHEKLQAGVMRDRHIWGWQGAFERLDRHLG